MLTIKNSFVLQFSAFQEGTALLDLFSSKCAKLAWLPACKIFNKLTATSTTTAATTTTMNSGKV